MITNLDIKTKFIPESQRIYRVFPGSRYKFYDHFKKESLIYLDIPGLPVPEDGKISDSEDLLERVYISQEVKRWHQTPINNDDGTEPVRSVEDVEFLTPYKNLKQLAGIVRNFFEEIQVGDIIIVPTNDIESNILFGEVVSQEVQFTESTFYPGEVIPAISVKWIYEQSTIGAPYWLISKLQNQNAVVQIPFDHYNYIFDRIYQRYKYKEIYNFKFSINAYHYSTLDDYYIQQFFLIVSALHHQYQADNLELKNVKHISEIIQKLEVVLIVRPF